MGDHGPQGRFKKGNRASMKHGCFSLGRTPKGTAYVQRLAGRLRSRLVRAVRQKHGADALPLDGLIQSACRHETRALLLTRWLRDAGDSLAVMDRVSLMREIGVATDARDRCIRALGLDGSPDLAALLGVPGGPLAADFDTGDRLAVPSDDRAIANGCAAGPAYLDGGPDPLSDLEDK
jgi:hypothetical protein